MQYDQVGLQECFNIGKLINITPHSNRSKKKICIYFTDAKEMSQLEAYDLEKKK